MKMGIGYDVHKMVPGRPLILGGVEIPFDYGLEGYSDADVLLHAVCDALLGAAGKGDIGFHFPPGDEQFKNISSLKLLKKVRDIISETYVVNNIDSIVVIEAPKITPYKGKMEGNIASVLNCSCVNVKATTTEGLGITGRGEAAAAYSVASLNFE